jgi:hypothetical protein
LSTALGDPRPTAPWKRVPPGLAWAIGLVYDRLGLRRSLPLLLGWVVGFHDREPFARSLGSWYIIRGLMGAAAELAHIGNRSDADERGDWPGIRAVFASRAGIGMLLVFLTFGYILFTFLN